MNFITFGLLTFTIALAGCGGTEVKQEVASKPSHMNDSQLKTLLIGKTMYGTYDGKSWASTMNSDGTVDSVFDGKAKKGIYTIKNNMYCRTWNNTGDTACWKMRKRTNDYYGKFVSGASSSFKFKVK